MAVQVAPMPKAMYALALLASEMAIFALRRVFLGQVWKVHEVYTM